MQPFEITDTVTFQNVNVRTEKHGDDDVLAVDLKFSGFFSAEEMCPLFGVDDFDVEAFKSLFWDKEGHQLFHAEHGIRWDYQMDGMQVELLKDGAASGQVQVFITNDAKVVRFSGLFTLAHGFILTFTVQTEIMPQALGALSAFLNDDLILSIEAIQGSLDLDSEDNPEDGDE